MGAVVWALSPDPLWGLSPVTHLHVMITYLHAILKSLDRIRRQLDATKHAPLTLS